MQKMKFRYQRFGLRVFLFVPFFLLLLVIADGLSNYIRSAVAFNLTVAVLTLVLMGLVFRVTGGMGQLRCTGECRIDDKGRCLIKMNRRLAIITDVREISAWRKSIVGSRYVQLIIRGTDGTKVRIFGVPMGPEDRMADDDLIGLFRYVLSNYPGLRQVMNMHGEPIDYWYKK